MTEEDRKSSTRHPRHHGKYAGSFDSHSSAEWGGDNFSPSPSFFARWWPVILSILICQILYWALLPTRLSSLPYAVDGGDFAAAVLTHGVPHPSGYPLYLLVSELFMLFGKANPIWTLALISTLSTGTLQSVLAYTLSRILDHRNSAARWIIAAAIFCLGSSTLLWSQSVIVEVYTFSYVVIPLYLVWELNAAGISKDKRKSKEWILLSWLCGLFWGAHLTMALVLPLVIFRLWKLLRTGLSTRKLLLGCMGWLSGLVLYALIPLRAAASPSVNWGNAIDWKGLIWLISGGGYAPLVFSVRPLEYLTRLGALIRLGLGDFTLIGLLLIISALVYKNNRLKLLPQCGYLMAVFTLFSVGYRTNDSFAYLIPVWIAATVLLAQELQHTQQISFLKIRVFPWLMAGILLMVLVQIPSRIKLLDPRDYSISDEAESMLTEAAPNSILYPEGDSLTFALWYYRYGMGMRPDVEVVSPGLMEYDWYRTQYSSKINP
jgi:hypothetical protein